MGTQEATQSCKAKPSVPRHCGCFQTGKPSAALAEGTRDEQGRSGRWACRGQSTIAEKELASPKVPIGAIANAAGSSPGKWRTFGVQQLGVLVRQECLPLRPNSDLEPAPPTARMPRKTGPWAPEAGEADLGARESVPCSPQPCRIGGMRDRACGSSDVWAGATNAVRPNRAAWTKTDANIPDGRPDGHSIPATTTIRTAGTHTPRRSQSSS